MQENSLNKERFMTLLNVGKTTKIIMEKMWRVSVTLLPLKYLLLSQRKTPIVLIESYWNLW